MSTLEDLDDLEREGKEEKKKEDNGKDGKKPDQNDDTEMKDVDGTKKEEEKEEDLIDTEILHSSTRDIVMRRRLLENDMRIMKSEYQRLTHEQAAMKEKIKDNLEKIVNNRYATVGSMQSKAFDKLFRTNIGYLDNYHTWSATLWNF